MGSPRSVTNTADSPLILFDGVCNLCNGAVQFVIKRDKSEKFRFAALQSALGQNYLHQLGVKQDTSTIILVKNNKVFDRSSAALEIARDLSGLWPVLFAFKIIPRFLRDGVYNFIARRRYRWFGRKDECMIPTPELKARFLDS
jgi:predicted DCC family thiol-disulfide oxidoreductase YuxK